MKSKLFLFVVLGMALAVPAMFGACSSSSDATDAATGTDTGGGTPDAGCTPACTAAACGDSDGCGGKCSGTCPEGTSCSATFACVGGGSQSFTATLTEFYTKQAVEGATVEAYDDATGDTLGISAKTDATGKVTLSGIADGVTKIAILSKKTDYLPTLQYHFPVDASEQKILVISNMTVTLIAGMLGVTLDPAKGVVAGGAFWGDIGDSEPIGCAKVTTTPTGGEIHYMGDDGKPTKSRDDKGTNVLDGLFTIVNAVPGQFTISMTVDGKTGESILPKLPAGTLAISNTYFDKATYAANPTPTACSGGTPDGGTTDSGDTDGGMTDAGETDGGTTGKTFSATLYDFQSKVPVKNADIEAYDDATGDTLGITGKTDTDGKITLTGIPADKTMIAIMSKATDYLPTMQYHFAADAQSEQLLIVGQGTVAAIGYLLSVTIDPAKGHVAGGVFWGDRTGPIGCSTITTDPVGGDIHYMGANGLPTKDRDALGTNPANGLFVSLNATPGQFTITSTVDGKVKTSVLPKLPAGTLAISNTVYDKVTYTTNPTPGNCQ